MSKNAANFPGSIWDSSSPGRTNDRSVDRAPVFEDWDQMVAEMLAVQTALDANMFLHAVPNPTGGAVVVGKAVYLLANGTGIALADANGTAPARNFLGLVSVGAPGSGGTVDVQQSGDLTLTTAQWDTVAGTTGGLTPFTEYYLSGTPGAITATVPGTTGDTDIVVGVAKSSTVLNIKPRFILSSHA
jgi:hypothetical protein